MFFYNFYINHIDYDMYSEFHYTELELRELYKKWNCESVIEFICELRKHGFKDIAREMNYIDLDRFRRDRNTSTSYNQSNKNKVKRKMAKQSRKKNR